VPFGLSFFPTDYSARPDEIARLAEELGFDSVWFPEHTHIPASRRTPYPGGGERPREYSHIHDPFVAHTVAAMATTKLRLATGICLIVQRDPITTAQQAASLDFLSGGRFIFGVGAGWNLEEMENHGTDPGQRFGIMRERVEAIREIWTKDEAEYHGKHVDFDPIWSWPKPVQQPHPPVVVGGNGPKVIDRVLRFGDEWMPNRGWDQPEELGRRITELRERAGRRVPVSYFGAPPKPERLEPLREAGLDRPIFHLPSVSLEELRPLVERHAGTWL
jgi:probable F420-dependent oxidoreductase